MENKKIDKELIRSLHTNDIFDEIDFWLDFDKENTIKTIIKECYNKNIIIENITDFWNFIDENSFDYGEDIDEILLNITYEMQKKYNIDIWND